MPADELAALARGSRASAPKRSPIRSRRCTRACALRPDGRRGRVDLPDRTGPGAGWPVIFFADSLSDPPDPLDSMVRYSPSSSLIAFAVLARLPVRRTPRRPSSAAAAQVGRRQPGPAQRRTSTRTMPLLIRNVQIDCNDIQLFADEAELFTRHRPHRARRATSCSCRARSRIAAERMEFNTRTKTGTFFNASGIANLENRGVDREPVRHRRSPTRISTARRSRSSGRRPTASSAAASRPACSRRRAGRWWRAR